MPVLPEVGSTRPRPFPTSPFSSSSRNIAQAARSLTEPIVPFEFGVELIFRRGIHLVDPHHRRRILLTGQQLENVVIDARLMIHVSCAGILTMVPDAVSRAGQAGCD